MQEISQTENTASYVMTSESVADYIQHEIDRGASKDSIRNFKRVTNSLFEWLPEDETITKDRLLDWRQSLAEQIHSTKAKSGYTGVTAKRGKWKAYIKYKGQNIDLGCYTNPEDAVKARVRGKELVQADALGLSDFYEELHKDDPALPNRSKVRQENKQLKQEPPESSAIRAVRSNNTSGHPGVHRKRNKWAAKITYMKTTYQLGVYEDFEGALSARLEAEAQLKKNPEEFSNWVLQRRKEVTKE